MADQLYEQFTEHYNDDGLAQFKEQFNPPAPVGVADWVDYTGDLPALRFADSAPCSLLGIQIWSRVPKKSAVERLYSGNV